MSHKHYVYVAPDALASQDDECVIWIHHLVGYCPQTLEYYQRMAELLKRSFPAVETKDVGCHHVTQSSCVKGFTLVEAKIRVKKSELGLPNAAEWKKMVDAKGADAHQSLKNIDADGHEWYVTAHRIDYYY